MGDVHLVDGIADIPHGVARHILDKVIHAGLDGGSNGQRDRAKGDECNQEKMETGGCGSCVDGDEVRMKKCRRS